MSEMKRPCVKCLVWDLDNTLWKGTLGEGDRVILNEQAEKVVKELDSRGILQSIASKNDRDHAMNKLKEFGIEQYFIYPQISWSPKSVSIQSIAKHINISLDTVAFVDDQPFELGEVQNAFPQVRCIPSEGLAGIMALPDFTPAFVTKDSARRREMYQTDIVRKEKESCFQGTSQEFLKSLNMVLTIEKASAEDLERVEELTLRTHQLNSTGYTYSFEQLSEMINSDNFELFTAELQDCYGSYGKIGIALLEKTEDGYVLKLILVSCRVISRGIGSELLEFLVNYAKWKDQELYAEFLQTDRNRMMLLNLVIHGFQIVSEQEAVIFLKYQPSQNYKHVSLVQVNSTLFPQKRME